VFCALQKGIAFANRNEEVFAMVIGYARVSTQEQDSSAQVKALKAAGCERIFKENAGGGRWDRPELHRLLDHLRAGDIVMVWKLDRLSRSLRDLLTIMERIESAKAGFKSVTEAIDTTTAAGRMMMQLIGTFAEFERAMLRERTKAGLIAARENGRVGGRKRALNAEQQREAIAMVGNGKSAAHVARLFGVHASTIGRIVNRVE